MSHCINVAVIKNDKLNIELNLQKNKLRYWKNGEYLIINPRKGIKRLLASFGVENMVIANTDYFGGCGEQNAIYTDLKTRKNTYFDNHSSINDALSLLGVKPDIVNKIDCYDIIGLGKFRDNQDLIELSKEQAKAFRKSLKTITS